ncbi:Maf family protein [Nitrincola tapanii]|uniref:7-methyl-GTP pyrophosphatase n=1 Tax=Nitrincola tapanii TaxID=1708751 RepID=A0A5A9W7U1_9GAMM|nr:Maf family nucleotide pyrophosphatase [Nitrincola tapanii]KAA0875521.1 septum formation inhibitor Maf [Nitrincola tapanii]
MNKSIVLASSSPYRRELLAKLGLPFRSRKPDVDETPLANETPHALVARLAEEKARAIAHDLPDALVIGSDQVAVVEGNILGKPGTHERAVAQLQQASGKAVTFLTGLCVLDASQGRAQTEVVPYEVHFRELSLKQIERYLEKEQPYDCAGSFKSEGLGIVLFERLVGDDPNALIGLPLIRLVRMLEQAGIDLP